MKLKFIISSLLKSLDKKRFSLLLGRNIQSLLIDTYLIDTYFEKELVDIRSLVDNAKTLEEVDLATKKVAELKDKMKIILSEFGFSYSDELINVDSNVGLLYCDQNFYQNRILQTLKNNYEIYL